MIDAHSSPAGLQLTAVLAARLEQRRAVLVLQRPLRRRPLRFIRRRLCPQLRRHSTRCVVGSQQRLVVRLLQLQLVPPLRLGDVVQVPLHHRLVRRAGLLHQPRMVLFLQLQRGL